MGFAQNERFQCSYALRPPWRKRRQGVFYQSVQVISRIKVWDVSSIPRSVSLRFVHMVKSRPKVAETRGLEAAAPSQLCRSIYPVANGALDLRAAAYNCGV